MGSLHRAPPDSLRAEQYCTHNTIHTPPDSQRGAAVLVKFGNSCRSCHVCPCRNYHIYDDSTPIKPSSDQFIAKPYTVDFILRKSGDY